jgi:hypothetical protein
LWLGLIVTQSGFTHRNKGLIRVWLLTRNWLRGIEATLWTMKVLGEWASPKGVGIELNVSQPLRAKIQAQHE